MRRSTVWGVGLSPRLRVERLGFTCFESRACKVCGAVNSARRKRWTPPFVCITTIRTRNISGSMVIRAMCFMIFVLTIVLTTTVTITSTLTFT